jgi:hypothetical protein
MKNIAFVLCIACASKESVPQPPVQIASTPAPVEEAKQQGTQSILVELFSSEGCSSCPSADTVLRELDETQPVAGAHVIALEFHVDYWNYLGWNDPFSSAEYSARQRDYGKSMKLKGVYTPQAVVDGQVELVGSERARLLAAIAKASANEHLRIGLTRTGEALQIVIPATKPYQVFLAQVERGLSTAVPRGENAGKTLAHAPVVRALASVGNTGAEAFKVRAEIPANRSAVVFLVDPETRAVVGAADVR